MDLQVLHDAPLHLFAQGVADVLPETDLDSVDHGFLFLP
jgi:hypothetical protein